MPSWRDPEACHVLRDGAVLAVEPMLVTRPTRVATEADGWTLRTQNGEFAAHVEHTIVVRRGAPLVLT